MPKKRNGFMVFVNEWNRKNGPVHISKATEMAGKIWQTMDSKKRKPYNECAQKSSHNLMRKKLNCYGVPIEDVEREIQAAKEKETKMKRHIEELVQSGITDHGLSEKVFYFMMVNYFFKSDTGGIYIPAEIGIIKFSLQQGVMRTYHSFVNPDIGVFGHYYNAIDHSNSTHQLPIPPNALGERDCARIYNDIINFITSDETNKKPPPVFTLCTNIPILESVLQFLKTEVEDDMEDIAVYSIQYLFFIMKETTCDIAGTEKPKSIFITDTIFERDYFEHQAGIGCEFHEQKDRSKYCAQSYVTRWGFTFADYMCKDLALSLVAGRHVPKQINTCIVNNTDTTNSLNAEFKNSKHSPKDVYNVKKCPENKLSTADMTKRDKFEEVAGRINPSSSRELSIRSSLTTTDFYVSLDNIDNMSGVSSTPSYRHGNRLNVTSDDSSIINGPTVLRCQRGSNGFNHRENRDFGRHTKN